ncbi:hypothetical protein BACCELL_01713, partial [Bacteroides cellulosilyticus DSM 14838]
SPKEPWNLPNNILPGFCQTVSTGILWRSWDACDEGCLLLGASFF